MNCKLFLRGLTLDPGQAASKARSSIRVATSVARSSATSLQMMQQWTGVNFIFYFGTRFFVQLGSIKNLFLISLILAAISPYFVGEQYGNLGPKVFFIWGGLCTCACVYAYFLVPETKGLILEQVDKMLEETTPRTSSKWHPNTTFAAEMGMTDGRLKESVVTEIERRRKLSLSCLLRILPRGRSDGLVW